MKKHSFLTAALIAAAALATSVLTAPAQAADKVVLMINWYVYGEHAPFYYGKEKGIFAAEGIDLDIQEGRGSAVTVQAVAAKTVPFGYADVPTMIRAAVKGAPVVAAGVALQKNPMSVMGFAEKSIRKPERRAPRPVNNESSAPTPKSASAVTAIATGSVLGPDIITKGASGSRAPTANERNDATAAPQGDPSSSGLSPSSSRASVSSACSGSATMREASFDASSARRPFAA